MIYLFHLVNKTFLKKTILQIFFFFQLGTNNSFRILLDKLENVSLGPREKFHIPIAFCPEILARQEAQLRIVGRLPPGKSWSPDK